MKRSLKASVNAEAVNNRCCNPHVKHCSYDTKLLAVSFHPINHLILNVNKTKRMIVDFRTRNNSNSIFIMGEEVEVVEEYKYLGVHLDNTLE